MKELLFTCLLVSLQSVAVTHAYEADIHYSTTYVLARAAGWTEADARTIASANQGVDENQDTVAALEVESILTSSFHQADKNLKFHCFSQTAGQAGQISADVRKVIAGHFAEVPDRDDDPRSTAMRLIALGAALHCQQDAHSHVGFGGSCGDHSGSCFGHSYETFLDQVVFGVLKKHYFNPDHPGVSGEHLLEALQGTASELTARRPKAHAIPTRELTALSDALRASGLQLPDDVRIECNRYIAGKWLFDFRSRSGTQNSADTVEKLSPEMAVTCKNESLASAAIVRIPDARFPRLNSDASPYLVKADGTYQVVGGGNFGASLAAHIPNYKIRKAKVQLSHWRQIFALPLATQVALAPANSKAR